METGPTWRIVGVSQVASIAEFRNSTILSIFNQLVEHGGSSRSWPCCFAGWDGGYWTVAVSSEKSSFCHRPSSWLGLGWPHSTWVESLLHRRQSSGLVIFVYLRLASMARSWPSVFDWIGLVATSAMYGALLVLSELLVTILLRIYLRPILLHHGGPQSLDW